MDKTEDSRRCKWSSSATNLLVSIWCHDMVQNQLNLSTRNQPIWESIARYMSKKGHSVTGLQCRTRIKNMMCSYYECVRKNDSTGLEPYFDIFKKVLEKKVPKKKVKRPTKIREINCSEEVSVDNELTLDSNLLDTAQMDSKSKINEGYDVEHSEFYSEDSEPLENCAHEIKKLRHAIETAIHKQTEAITKALSIQSQMTEKLLMSERQKLDSFISLEKESNSELRSRLDRLLDKFDVNILPQVTYMGTLIETREAE